MASMADTVSWALEALDLPLLQRQRVQLIAGETISVLSFDFVAGRRLGASTTMRVSSSETLVIEGIRVLNPGLVDGISRN